MTSRVKAYADFHQCSLQEAQRVIGLEDRLKSLREMHSRLGEVYTPQTVADQLRELLELITSDTEAEYRR